MKCFRGSVVLLATWFTLQLCATALAVCREPLAGLLDQGLQRALVADAIDGAEGAFPVPADVAGDPDAGDLVLLTLDDVLTPASIGRAIDCAWVLDEVVRRNLLDLPPSVVPSEFSEVPQQVHARWYLASVHPGSYSDAFDELQVGASDYGDVAYGFPGLDLFLIHVSSIEQFRELIQGRFRAHLVHLMENFPMKPAWTSARGAIGVPSPAFASVSGSRYSIAVIDTGVNREHFSDPDEHVEDDRIVYEACFSTTALLVIPEITSQSLCPPGEPLPKDWEVVFEDAPEGLDLQYGSVAVSGTGVGAPCELENDCRHGTKVAYLAAGVQSEANRERLNEEIPPGIATGASIVAIQVASHARTEYCVGEKHPGHPCVVIFPLDVLRALKHVAEQHRSVPDVFGGTDLVAVNLSLQLGRLCHKPPREDGENLGDCATNVDEAPKWERASYDKPCATGPFHTWVEELKHQGVWTVVAAGNRKSKEKVGAVSLPACVPGAVTVAGSDDGPGFTLSSTSMFSNLVDFVAPGVEIYTPAVADSASGTSFAAPQVAGVLTLLRSVAAECAPGDMTHEETWLEAHTVSLTIPTGDLPSMDLEADLDTLVLSLASAAYTCP